MRQQGENRFINLLNNVRLGTMTEEDERILKSKFISQDDQNYPWDALHLFAENSMVKAHNDTMIDTLLTPMVNTFAIEQYPRGVTESKKQEVRSKNYTDTGGLPYKLDVRVGARVLLTTESIQRGPFLKHLFPRHSLPGKFDLLAKSFKIVIARNEDLFLLINQNVNLKLSSLEKLICFHNFQS